MKILAQMDEKFDPKHSKLIVCNENLKNENLGKKIYCEIFVMDPKMHKDKRCIGLIDSGADLSIIQQSYLKRLQREDKDNTFDTSSYQLTSYSNNTIRILRGVTLKCKFRQNGQHMDIKFYVINDIDDVPPLLLGADFMRTVLMNVAFTGSHNKPMPEVKIHVPETLRLNTFYADELEIQTCWANLNMEPNTSKTIAYEMHPASYCLENDTVLISDSQLPDIMITPSRSKIIFDKRNQKYMAYALTHNTSNRHIQNKNTGKIEILTNERSIPIAKRNFHKLKNMYLLKEVQNYDGNNNLCTIDMEEDLPKFGPGYITVPNTIYKITKSDTTKRIKEDTNTNRDMSKSEFNEFYDDKYTVRIGPAHKDVEELEPDILEPKGYTVPEEYLRRPEDIIELEKFEKVQRPYIKKIFLEKYPKLIATSSLDRGNLSKTLGKYQIRLKDNEQLPKHKKVFFLSPSETQHLRDILSFMIESGVISKTPISEDNSHLYGSPSYLIPRSRPGAAARLIVDYRMVNQLIKLDPNVLPDIPSILHSLRDKHLHSVTDLANAYLSYSLTDDCRYLSNFLTPLGPYTHNCLPTGIASSPEAFARAAAKMVHEK